MTKKNSELFRPDDGAAYRNKMRRELERKQQDRKIMQNMLKVLFLMLILIVVAVVSVSDGVSADLVTNISSPLSI